MLQLLTLTLLATVDPNPIDPFFNCAWNTPMQPAGQNIGFTAFGYKGLERGFRIHHGNYDDVNDNLDYTIEVLWDVSDCAGTVYTIRFPNHGLTNHVEIEIRGDYGALMGRLEATKGSLPVLYNQNDAPLPTNKLGPFVITNGMVGGANGMAQTITFTLLDAEILRHLPAPIYYNGAAPASIGEEAVMDAAYEDLVEEYEYFFTFFTFRRMLGGLSASERVTAQEAIDAFIDTPGPIHGDPFYEEHHHINHGAAVGSVGAAGFEFGGFWNGHRNFLAQLEADMRAQTRLVPFRRVPAWDPATTIPLEFQGGVPDPVTGIDYAINDPNGGSDLGTDYKAANICASYANALSGAATLADRLLEMEEILWGDVASWHNGVHVDIGGDFVPFDTTAGCTIFHPWHTAIDTIWRNFQLCEAAYHPLRYSWDEM